MHHCVRRLAFLPLLFLLSTLARADEGMWLLNRPPVDKIKADYGFTLTQAWIEHVQKASVRFNSGGSGAFVSSDGLVITNHHIAVDALQKLSTAKDDMVARGFLATSPAQEIPCVDLELNVLDSIEDVTARVNAAVPAGATDAAAVLARRKATAEIEKESRDKTGLRSDVVTLYQGGEYQLYRYRRYTDVRLVFAPEQQIAFFGGDPDNFEFPRYDLDVAFFRVYDHGKPVHSTHYLRWSVGGAKEGELVFVTGNPGHTDRLLTSADLAYLRDVQFPFVLNLIKRREVLLSSWSQRNAENARRAAESLFIYQNSRKVRDGQLAALQDPAFFASKAVEEKRFIERALTTPGGAAAVDAFARIAAADQVRRSLALRYSLLEQGMAFDCDSFSIARRLLRSSEERTKPNGDRLPEYSDARRDSFELSLLSAKPIHRDLEILTLSDSLTLLTESLGFNDPTVQAVLAGKSPRERAAELIRSTQVRDVAFRKALYQGGASAIDSAKDPMIELARAIDPEARRIRKEMETQDEACQQAYATLARVRYTLEGGSHYPDATFTLRLAYGKVQGYDQDGSAVPAFTDLAGLFQRCQSQGGHHPFDLPGRWLSAEKRLNLATKLNFVSSCDITGGNSGSPTINRDGAFVGIIFDGNLQSLAGDFYFDGRQNRAISVDGPAIIEALRKIYGAGFLADELLAGHR